MDIICYLLVGICGYITCPINTPDLIIERPKIGDTDYLISLARVMFFMTLVVKMPNTYIALRISLLSMLNIKEEDMTNTM